MSSRRRPIGDRSSRFTGSYLPGEIKSLAGTTVPTNDDELGRGDDPFAPFSRSNLLRDDPRRRPLYDLRRSESNSSSLQPLPERSLLAAPTPVSAPVHALSFVRLTAGDATTDLRSSLLNMPGASSSTISESQQQPEDPSHPVAAAPSHPSRGSHPSTAPGPPPPLLRRQASQRSPRFAHAYSAPSGSPSQETPASGVSVSLSYPGAPAYGAAPASFGGTRSGFVPPYAMSHQQPPISIIHSPPPFAYPHHPPMQAPSVPIRYSSPSYAPMMHASIYNPYCDPTTSQALPYSTATNPSSMAVFAPSPPPLSPVPGPHRSFQPQPVYGYSTPQYGYPPPPSFSQSPRMYPSYGHPGYGQQQQFPGSSDQDSQGTWWYVPNASTPLDQPSFPMPYFPQQPPQLSRRPSETAVAQSSSQPLASPQQPSQSATLASAAQRHQTAHVGPGVLSPTTLPPVPIPALQSAVSAAPSSVSDLLDGHGRKPYHPNPPVHRSEWVMWAGNVPSDATHDELWRFFNQAPPSHADLSPLTASVSVHGGVSSIFLITRSNCAFVNFETEAHLEAATERFNGQPLRPTDPRCPRLVCRVRRMTDDLKAGVGGQRGMGMHTGWVKEQRALAASAGALGSPVSSPEAELGVQFGEMSLSDEEGRRGKGRAPSEHTNSSESFASSNSSFLTKYFPQRYFILKSLTQHDLDLSVQQGVWATQRHNEGILDQAFRTSQDVFLIFGVNKSGEFYGYARMTSGVQHSDDRVPWETRSGHGPAPAILSPTENRYADASPQPVSGLSPGAGHEVPPPAPSASSGHPQPLYLGRGRALASAPTEMHQPHRQLSHAAPPFGGSLNVHPMVPMVPPASVPATTFELDTTAPIRHMRDQGNVASDLSAAAEIRSTLASVAEAPSQESSTVPSPLRRPGPAPVQPPRDPSVDNVWGHSFKIEWIRTERLPFHRTRHLRNPWNHGREVKVSRDGTELEPSVGRELLAEWDRPPPDPGESSKPPSGRRRPPPPPS